MGSRAAFRWSHFKAQGCLTMRAADGGWAARFLAFFVALGFSHFDRESTLQPTAANAVRWVASLDA